MARLLAGHVRHLFRRARGRLGQGAGRGSGGGGGFGRGSLSRSLGRRALGLGFGEAVVRGLVEREIHARLDMEVKQRLESIAVGREILHGVYVSIRMDVDN